MRRTGKRAFEPTIGSEGMSQLLMTYSIFMTRGSSQDRKRSAARTELPGAGERCVFSHELPAQEKRAPEGARFESKPVPGLLPAAVWEQGGDAPLYIPPIGFALKVIC